MTTSSKKFNPLFVVLGLSTAFFVIFLVISGAFYLYRSPGKPAGSGSGIFGAGSVGIVEVTGPIMDSKKVLSRLEEFAENGAVKSIVVRLNSPGGAVGPSQEIYEALKKFPKPVVASMGTVAASGAFYISCGAQKVYANPGTLTGSIGVIMDFVNLEKLYEWAKIKRYSLKTGKFKASGAEYREMTAEERELFQTMLEDVLDQFKTAVSEGRKLPMTEVDKIADGRIMSGNQAKKAKLVDELGTLQDAVDEAAKLAGIKGKPNVVYPSKSGRKWLEMLMDETSAEEAEASLLMRLLAWVEGRGATQLTPAVDPGIYWMWKGNV
jgi:protease-4